ncbi:MAG: hypothetical protein SGILL_010393 [Bacillariaceae sp.]
MVPGISAKKGDDDGSMMTMMNENATDSESSQVPRNDSFSEIDVDAALAKELTKLSCNDRNKVQEEVHGVEFAMPEETPQLIERSLRQLDQHVQQIASKPAYDHAVSQLDASYIQSDAFRTAFVRAAMFDIPQAAQRYTSYLNLLHEFFGDKGLQRPLQFKDLSKADKDCLKEGRRQILPSRDRSGRLIMFEKGGKPSDTRHQRVRSRLFIWSILAEDVETQKKGVCGIAELRPDMFADMTDKEAAADYKAIMDAIPMRFSAIHLILNFPSGPMVTLIKSAVVMGLFGSQERVRTKVYEGLNTEIHYELMTYGIPVQEIPLTSGGNIKTKNLTQWIKTRRAIDNLREEGDTVAVNLIIAHPNIHDVLFSRGGNPQHLGNKDFHHFLASMNDRYNDSSMNRDNMELIRNELVRSVAAKNGRFLQVRKEGGWWEEIFDQESVHFKINNGFYDHNRKQKAIQNQQAMGSSTSEFLESSKRRKIEGQTGCLQNLFGRTM